MGDLNSDGYPEIAMTAGNGDYGGNTDIGYLMLILGGPSFAANWASPIILTGESANHRFGHTSSPPP